MIRLKIITIASITLHLVHYPLKKKTFLLGLKYLTARENLKALLNIFSKLIPHTWKQQITKSNYRSHTERGYPRRAKRKMRSSASDVWRRLSCRKAFREEPRNARLAFFWRRNKVQGRLEVPAQYLSQLGVTQFLWKQPLPTRSGKRPQASGVPVRRTVTQFLSAPIQSWLGGRALQIWIP